MGHVGYCRYLAVLAAAQKKSPAEQNRLKAGDKAATGCGEETIVQSKKNAG